MNLRNRQRTTLTGPAQWLALAFVLLIPVIGSLASNVGWHDAFHQGQASHHDEAGTHHHDDQEAGCAIEQFASGTLTVSLPQTASLAMVSSVTFQLVRLDDAARHDHFLLLKPERAPPAHA